MLNILINAYAVSPSWGSEPGMGWNWVINIAKYCNVYVITEGEFRDEIERAVAILPQKDNLHFYYNPVSDKIRKMCWNQGNWLFYYYYRKWQESTFKIAKSIVRDNHIDVIHQLNMIGFREPGYLWRIKKIPFVWGPIGGCEMMPLPILSRESLKAKIAAVLKNIINYFQAHYSFRVREAVRASKCVIAAVQAAYDLADSYYRHPNVLFINETGLDFSLPSIPCKSYNTGTSLQLLWVGKFDYRKKLDIALETVSLLKDLDVHLTIAGIGNNNQVSHYHTLTNELGISDKVTFLGKVPNSDIPELMRKSDLFFFTSIMEATSTVVPEAISNNLPILCFNTCGFGRLVKDKVGETIEITDYDSACQQFASKIRYLSDNRAILSKYSKACEESKIELSWDSKAKRVVEIYQNVSLPE